MISEFDKGLLETEYHSEYDEAAKRLLSKKSVLAKILSNVIDELKDMKPEDVIPLIEGEPVVSQVPIDPGLTNKFFDERIRGMNNEDASGGEGLIRFDIIFFVKLSDGLSEIIVNLEVQRKDPSEYDILNRAIFYTSRMISSQKGRDFQKSEYNDIRRVYSIWICMKTEESCTTLITLNQNNILGHHEWKGDLRLFNIVMIGVPEKLSDKDEHYGLHRFLNGLLSNQYSYEEKKTILKDYHVESEEDLVKEVQTMCNLSLGVKEDGYREGVEETRLKFAKDMLKDNFPYEMIAKYTELTVEQIKEIEKKL